MAPAASLSTTLSLSEKPLEAGSLAPIIRGEVDAALQKFAEDTLRQELEKMGDLVRKAVADAQAAAADAAAAAREKRGPVKLLVSEVRDGIELAGVTRHVHIEDLHIALDEWWRNHRVHMMLTGLDLESDFKKPPITRQDSACSTSAGGHGGFSATADDVEESPPLSPAEFVLPPAGPAGPDGFATQAPRETPASSPVLRAASAPSSGPPTPLHGPFGAWGGSGNVRRSFVQRALKANSKIEQLGYRGGETAVVSQAIEEATRALEGGIKPHLVEDGLGGTYFMKNGQEQFIAVFKPHDEEPMGPNNPKEHQGPSQERSQGTPPGSTPGLKDGVLVGEAAVSELAAYLVDQASGKVLQAGVCPTALVSVRSSAFHFHEEGDAKFIRGVKDKVGSFQLFAEHDCTSEDLGPSKFPDDQVHRLAILDIRLCNTDRHSGNILVKEGEKVKLIPIDHGFALPGELGNAAFEWLNWPASKRPFSPEMARAVLDIDAGAVEKSLRRKVPELRSERFLTLHACTILLQCGVRAGLTPFDIGGLMVRPDDYDGDGGNPQLSELEELAAKARELARPAPPAAAEGEEPYLQALRRLFDARCEQLAKERGRTPL